MISPARAAEEVHRRHPDIPQDTLPLDWPTPVRRRRQRAPRGPRATRYVICPSCTGQKIAVEDAGVGERIRPHWKILPRGVRVVCPASGQDPIGARPSVT